VNEWRRDAIGLIAAHIREDDDAWDRLISDYVSDPERAAWMIEYLIWLCCYFWEDQSYLSEIADFMRKQLGLSERILKVTTDKARELDGPEGRRERLLERVQFVARHLADEP
jgi:hypothetical protein